MRRLLAVLTLKHEIQHWYIYDTGGPVDALNITISCPLPITFVEKLYSMQRDNSNKRLLVPEMWVHPREANCCPLGRKEMVYLLEWNWDKKGG